MAVKLDFTFSFSPNYDFFPNFLQACPKDKAPGLPSRLFSKRNFKKELTQETQENYYLILFMFASPL